PRRVKERHLKMAFKQDGRILRGIAWRASERESFVTEHRAAIDLAFSLENDTYNGERYLQLSVADFRAPENGRQFTLLGSRFSVRIQFLSSVQSSGFGVRVAGSGFV